MTAEFKVARVGMLGDGLTHDGLIAPRSLPGEVITATQDDKQLTDIRIVEPSEARVKPPCRHYKSCGGCQLQHASDAFVADWKQSFAQDQLARHGLKPEFRPLVTSPERSRRRAGFSARRTKSGAMAGFHMRGSDALVDVQDCAVLTESVQGGIEMARQIVVLGGSRKAEISVHVTETLDGLDVVVRGGKPLDDALRADLPQMFEAHNVARLTWDGELVAQAAAPRVRLGGADVVAPHGAFLQATEHGQSTLQDAVADAVSGVGLVADLFSGCGTFALDLAAHHPVHAVEGDAEMVSALDEAARHASLTHPISVETRDLYANPLLPYEMKNFEGVVLDPPRAGALAQVEQLALSEIDTLAYVSCDPSTFARDAARLVEAGFNIEWVQVVDQFRWSSHIELAASLRRSHMQV